MSWRTGHPPICAAPWVSLDHVDGVCHDPRDVPTPNLSHSTALKMSNRHACWQNGHISSMWAWIAHPGPGTPREDCRAPLCNGRSVPRCLPAQIIMLE